MDYFDKRIKEEFSKFDSEIPAGMSWSEMEAGIQSKMPQRKRRWLPIFFFCSLAGLGILVLLSLKKCAPDASGNQPDIVNNTERILPQAQKINPTEEINTIDPNTIITADVKTKTSVLPTISTDIKNTSEARPSPIIKNRTALNKQTKTKLSSSSESVTDNTLAPAHSSNKETIANSLDSTILKEISIASTSSTIQNISPITTSPIAPLKTINEDLPLNSFASTYDEDQKKIKTPAQSQLGLQSGVVLWNWGSQTKNAKAIENFEKTLPSYSVYLHYRRSLLKNWGIETGLRYHQLESVFENTFVSQHNQIKQNANQPVYNLVTQVSRIEAAGEVTVTEKRTIKHFNNIKQLEIPLVIYRSFNHQRWSADIGVGTSFALWTLPNGRSINSAGAFVDYQQNSTIKTFTGFSGILKTDLAYRLNDSWTLTAGLSYQKALSNWVVASEVSRRPQLFYFGLGVRKSI